MIMRIIWAKLIQNMNHNDDSCDCFRMIPTAQFKGTLSPNIFFFNSYAFNNFNYIIFNKKC